MLPYHFYKLLHLIGIFLILTGLAGALLTQVGGALTAGTRRVAGISHGIGMLFALVGGFGMMARLQIHWPWPGWLAAKLAVWILLGGLMGVGLRKPALARRLWWLPVLLATTAAWLALYQPG